jgi:hypothetical protein
MTTHNAPRGSFHLPHLHVWEGWRKYVSTFLGLLVAAALGVASAAWFSTPNGHGNAYGHGRGSSGLALTALDYSDGINPGITDIGPSETGTLVFALHNPNPNFDAVATSVTPSGPLFSVDDPIGCNATAPAAVVSAWSGSLAVPRGGNSANATMAITTSGTLPVCMSNHVLAIDVTIVSSPAP